jgi:hypothetical protein
MRFEPLANLPSDRELSEQFRRSFGQPLPGMRRAVGTSRQVTKSLRR